MSLLKDLKGKAGQTIDVAYLSSQVDAKRKASFDDEAKALKTVTFTLPGGGAAAAAATLQAVEEVLYRSKDLYPIWTFTKQPNNSFARSDSYSAIIYAMTETEEAGKLVCNHYDAVSALQDGVLSDKVPGGYSPLDSSELGRNLPEGMRNTIIEATKGQTDKEGLRIFVKMGRRG